MRALERLRSWLTDLLGRRDDSPNEAREGSSPDTRDSEGLDPSGATETRTTGQDNAVEALRETRHGREGAGEQDPATDAGDRDGG